MRLAAEGAAADPFGFVAKCYAGIEAARPAAYELFSSDLSKLGKGPTVDEVRRLADQYRESES